MKRFVIATEKLGIFVGTAVGLGFWSKQEDAGQVQVASFDDYEQASSFSIEILKEPNFYVKEVEAAADYVTVPELRAAGFSNADIGLLLMNTDPAGSA